MIKKKMADKFDPVKVMLYIRNHSPNQMHVSHKRKICNSHEAKKLISLICR